MMFSRNIYQRFTFAIGTITILYCLLEMYFIVFDYYGFLERIINYSKFYFILIYLLILLTAIQNIITYNKEKL